MKTSSKLIAVAAASMLLAGCGSVNQQAGEALDASFTLIQPMYELGIQARTADPGMTIEEFLDTNSVSRLTDEQAAILLQTAVEHQETINALKEDI